MVQEEETLEVVREQPRHFFKRRAWYRRRVESLEAQAAIDDLTGLRNQRALWRELSRRGAAGGSPLAIVMLDFDMFNEVNERYGHAVGDRVLRHAASVLRDAAPSPRLAFRYGGEEFVLLTPGDEEDGCAVAERVRSAIARQNDHLPAVTVSCGVAELDGPVEPWVALDRADAALRGAKRAGRNRVVAAGRADPDANAYLVEELERNTARRAALALAMVTLEVRDTYTAAHSDDVLTICEAIGRGLGFEGQALERLMAGAQLHDVGKVAVASEILNKPGPLDEDEWAVIREHTVIGERILRSVPEMAEVATIVRHSHERWDGGGYPDGLTGEQIPFASRVILCADAFHSIRSDRPYRAGRPALDAIAELRACAGSQLDPAVVDALVEVAEDVRSGRANRAAGVSPRNKRLIALLAALAIGSGMALAALPEVRDAIRSLFGVATATSKPLDTFSYDPGTGFSFGPLGDVLSIAPTTVGDRGSGTRAVVPRAVAAGRKRSASGAPPRPSGAFGGPRTSQRGPTSGGGGRDGAPGGTTGTDTGGTAPAHSKGTRRGNGRALGRSLPTPRRPAQSPSRRNHSGRGRPQSPGRTDPPALGHRLGPAAPAPNRGSGNGKG